MDASYRPKRVFACSNCPKKFVRPDLYARHRVRHSKGMFFRNTGGVVDEDVETETILEPPSLSPTLHMPTKSSDSPDIREPWASNAPLAGGDGYDVYSARHPADVNVPMEPGHNYQVNPTSLGFNYGSPQDDPSTLFFDDSANIWDLPDNLDWFFETSQHDGAIAVADGSFLPQQPQTLSFGTSLLPINESAGVGPTMTDSCWLSVQSRLLDSLSSLPHEVLHSHFFHPTNLASCYNRYFENYHPHFPIFHRPTLDILEAEPLLIASIVTLGSTLAPDDEIYHIGQKVHDSLRWIIFQTGKFEPPSPLWCLQALLLVQAQAKMFSTRKNHEMAHIFHGAILTMMKRGRAYSPSPEPDGNQYTSLDNSWWQWVEQESSRRTAFFAFIMDAQHSSVFGHTPVLSVSDIRLPLPCSESLWQCPSAVSWHDEFQRAPKPVQFLPTLKGLLGKNLASPGYSGYTRFILLHGFLSLINHLHAREGATLGIGSRKLSIDNHSTTAAPTDDWIETISRAIEVWSFSLISLEPSLCLEAAKSLHRMAHITLHANIVDFHILAKDPALLKNSLSKKEWDKAEARLKSWSKREEASRVVYHALLLVKETVLSGRRYYAREDNVAARPWCLYNAIMVLWGYGEAIQTTTNYPYTGFGAEEYLARMLSGLESKIDISTYAKSTHGLLLSMRSAFEGCRWELLEDAYQTLGRLAVTVS